MREDFAKLLVHTSRYGGKKNNDVLQVRRSDVQVERDEEGDWEDVSSDPKKTVARGKTGIRQKRHGKENRKEFGENLKPLFRFLRSRVGRPWDEVFSEIRETCRPRSTVGAHIYQHLWDMVVLDCHVGEDGKVWRNGDSSPLSSPSGKSFLAFYVHPETGLLCKTPEHKVPRWGDLPLQQEIVRLEGFVWVKAQKKIFTFREDEAGGGHWFEVSLLPLYYRGEARSPQEILNELRAKLLVYGFSRKVSELASKALARGVSSRSFHFEVKIEGPISAKTVSSF